MKENRNVHQEGVESKKGKMKRDVILSDPAVGGRAKNLMLLNVGMCNIFRCMINQQFLESQGRVGYSDLSYFIF